MADSTAPECACERTAPGLLSVDAALGKLLGSITTPMPVVDKPILAALGDVLAQGIVSHINVPPCANSAVDGYAFLRADLGPDQTLPLSLRIPAGAAPDTLPPGTAARIFTGAPVPAGADAVAMQEDCVEAEGRVRLPSHLPDQENIRPAGQDIALDSTVLQRGTRLSPAALGVLASIGQTTVAVHRRPRVAFFSTGDELAEPGQPLAPGQIYNSNRVLLGALLAAAGVYAIDLGVARDNLADTIAILDQAEDMQADVILSTGGVSVGEEDHVRAAILSRGELALWKLAIKPGKPLAFGRYKGRPVFGLPGNPQATLITFLILVRPWLRRLMGERDVAPLSLPLPAGFTIKKPGKRREYLRVRVELHEGRQILVKHPQQSSGALTSAAWGQGLAEIEVGRTVQEGDLVPFLPFSGLWG